MVGLLRSLHMTQNADPTADFHDQTNNINVTTSKNFIEPVSVAEWLWRVTQAISFCVQRSAFSWALPAGVRIPLYSSYFCSFETILVCLNRYPWGSSKNKHLARIFERPTLKTYTRREQCWTDSNKCKPCGRIKDDRLNVLCTHMLLTR